MCHNLSFSASTVEFITDLLPNIVFDHQLGIDFSITSHVLSMSNRKCLVIYSKNGQPYLNEFEWGLIANYMNTPELIKKYRTQTANAKSEKLSDKNSEWYKIRHQRCLIAVDGIYESRKINDRVSKVPYFIKLKDSEKILLPGLYNYSPRPDVETGEMKGTFAVLTRAANDVMKKIHNEGPNLHRMPVFMKPQQALRWIEEGLTDQEITDFLTYEIPSEELEVWPVYKLRTTKPRPDGKEKYEPFVYNNLPELGNDGPVQVSLF